MCPTSVVNAFPYLRCHGRQITLLNNNINNNNNNNTNGNVYGAINHHGRTITRVHPVHLERRQAAADPQTKPNDLGRESIRRLPESTSTIAIYYYYSTESWYLFYRPAEGRRLSRRSWLVTYRDGLPPHRRSPISVLTGSDVAQLRWSRSTRRYHSAKPPTTLKLAVNERTTKEGVYVGLLMSVKISVERYYTIVLSMKKWL